VDMGRSFRKFDFNISSLIQIRVIDAARAAHAGRKTMPIAARLKGSIVGLQTILPSTKDFELEFIYPNSEEALAILRHSAAHLLARSLLRLFPGTRLGFGPSVKDGFYCDFKTSREITESDLPMIESEMRSLVAGGEGGSFECLEVSFERAVRILEETGQPFKLEHLRTHLRENEKIFFYRQGEFLDMSRGPHVMSAELLQHFRLMSVTETHWRGDPSRESLQRIYGTAFFSEEKLNEHLKRLEEAKKRDHRHLGRQLELYAVDPRVGTGVVLWLPKGAVIRRELENFLFEEQTRNGFQRVYSPEIGRVGLFRMSGKNPYSERSYPLFGADRSDSYALRPTCGSQHVVIYQNHPRSYRELPLRFFEFGNVCRYESGEYSGLKRLRAFTRNDAHVFCSEEQAADEFRHCVEMLQKHLLTFGFSNLRIQTCFRSENGISYSGTREMWERWEKVILEECSKLGLVTYPGGEVHPEGPGIDCTVEDSLGREWHFGTVHIDFKVPGEEAFDLSYVGTDNVLHRPMMIHCTPLDSFERFIGVLIEHFAGAFPLWMAPEQVRILIVSPKYEKYAREVEDKFRKQGIRVTGDYRSEKIGAKIRRAQVQLVPYMLIIGERELEGRTVAVRDRVSGSQGNLVVEEAIRSFLREIRDRKLKHDPGTV